MEARGALHTESGVGVGIRRLEELLAAAFPEHRAVNTDLLLIRNFLDPGLLEGVELDVLEDDVDSCGWIGTLVELPEVLLVKIADTPLDLLVWMPWQLEAMKDV